MKNSILKLRIVLWSGLALLLIFLAVMKIVPTGYIPYKTNFLDNSFFINKITPLERVKNKNTIIDNPVYFSLFTPRKFDRARLTFEYKDNLKQGLIETGVLVYNKTLQYRLAPVENSIIDDLSKSWNTIKDGQKVLLQREKKYSSTADFLKNLPAREKIALYNTEIKNDYILPDYKASDKLDVINEVLCGSYNFFTYIKDEDLNFDFGFQDLNQNRNSDEIDINLYQNNKIINTWHLADDGNVSDNGKLSADRKFNINEKNLPEGVYKIELKTNDDILTKNISTKQSKLAFENTLQLARAGEKNITLFTDGKELSAKTTNPDSLQTLLIGDKKLVISETYKQFTTQVNSEKILIEKDGLILTSNGVFSFEVDKLINPNFKKVDKNLDFNQVDYILADYKSPITTGAEKIAQVDIDLTNAYREKGKYSFMLSLPGINPENGENLEIKNLKVELFGKGIFEKIKDIIKR